MKELIAYFDKESDAPKGRIILMSSLSGVANALLLAVINVAAAQVSNQAVEASLFIIYLLVFILFIYMQRYALSQTTIAVEGTIRNVRLRIANKIRHAELRFIEENDKSDLYKPFTEESSSISYAATILVTAGQSVIMLVAVGAYLAYLSPLSLIVSIFFIVFATIFYLSHHRKITEDLNASYKKESEVFKALVHVLEGFKELKINQSKSDDVFQHIADLAEKSRTLKVSANLQLILKIMYSQMTFYTLLIILVFVIPLYVPSHAEIIFKVSATVLFIMGPINNIVGSIPILAQVNVSIKGLYTLEDRLDAMADIKQEDAFNQPIESFHEISFRDVKFSYIDKTNETLFVIGPIDLSIQQGEMLFIIGGNGSGKSTFLKLLCGLYYPSSGYIQIDEDRIDKTNYQSYRELFSIIFTDFYLFDRLYGLSDIDENRVRELLKLMELDKKTSYVNGRFSHLDLSTGQKKRLAFIVSILENKPVCIFDELAADQDPGFRRNFYEKILPDLKQQGITVIAVTHDDKYFHVADRVLKMDFGNFIEYSHDAK